ncbi:MAG: hypothetical protein V1848_00620, partial [Candidatus Magasanikbacteria bacterium]
MNRVYILIIGFSLPLLFFFCFRFEGKIDYSNDNIPKIYRYTEKKQIIPEEFLIKKFVQQSGYVRIGEEYNNTYFYEKEGNIYCKNSHIQPKEITYYRYHPGS